MSLTSRGDCRYARPLGGKTICRQSGAGLIAGKRAIVPALLGLLLSCGSHRPPVLEPDLEREIEVREDLGVFTLFALLNAAGYDQENRAAGMHPVRIQVREALERTLDPGLRASSCTRSRTPPCTGGSCPPWTTS
jgi:hypothetical protein